MQKLASLDFWHDWSKIPPSRLVAYDLPCQNRAKEGSNYALCIDLTERIFIPLFCIFVPRCPTLSHAGKVGHFAFFAEQPTETQRF